MISSLLTIYFYYYLPSTQILEEVGYAADQIKFIRSGRPLYVDASDRLSFAVHPFLFDLVVAPINDDERNEVEMSPRLNWENVDAQFIPPDSLKKSLQPLVPQLSVTVERVLLSTEQEAMLEKISKDREHGAAQLAVWVLDALEEVIARSHSNENEEEDENGAAMVEQLRNFGYHLSCCRPSMAPLATTAARFLFLLHQALHDRASPFPITVEEVGLVASHILEKEREHLKTLNSRLITHALALIHDDMTIMTLSKSSSVSTAILEALKQGKRLKIIVCESRPLCEGVISAKLWANAGASVTVITDAQAGVFIKQANMVLVGADAVDSEHGVFNKVGTRLVALAAKETKGCSFYVLADSSKIYPGPLEKLAHPGEGIGEDLGEEKEAEEVKQGWFGSVELTLEGGENSAPPFVVRNVYFEATPLELVTAVVTEDGVMGAEAIEKEIELVKEVYIEAFQLQL